MLEGNFGADDVVGERIRDKIYGLSIYILCAVWQLMPAGLARGRNGEQS